MLMAFILSKVGQVSDLQMHRREVEKPVTAIPKTCLGPVFLDN